MKHFHTFMIYSPHVFTNSQSQITNLLMFVVNQSFDVTTKNSRIRFNCVMKFIEIRDWDFVKLFGDQFIINIFYMEILPA